MIAKHVEILKEKGIKPKTVLEIGSRDGDDANFYKEQFNLLDEDVFVVEPNPSQAQKIREKYPKINLFECAIFTEETEKDFYQVTGGGKDPIGISSLLERNDDWYERFGTNKIKVKTIKGSTLLEEIDRDIDICKIDTEGATYEVLLSLGEHISRIKSIHVETELHQYWKNQVLHDEVAKYLTENGFEQAWYFEAGMQADSIWLKKEFMKNNFNDVEIHTLICKKDLTLAVNNFKSLQRYEEFANMVVVLHDDGSLSKEDLPMLEKIKNMVIIWREDADMKIKSFVEKHPNCKSYRLGDSHINLWHKIKLFDYFYFSKTKKILGMDTDLLFLRKPENVIRLMRSETPFYFPDIQSAYCFNEPKDVKVLENVNTGLIYLPDESYYNIDAIENALVNLVGKGVNYFPSWIEQSAFAHMFYVDGRYESLELKKYGIPYFQRIDSEIAECLHFVSYEGVRATYDSYLEYVNLSGEKIFTKEYKVEFQEKQIPIQLTIYDDGDKLFFKFIWELQKAEVNALDHLFEIVSGDKKFEFKFQSDKHGFFSIPKEGDMYININHATDWYGEIKWVEFENELFISKN